MKNTKKTSKKSKKNAKPGFFSGIKITKKNILIISAVICGILVITGTIIGVRSYKKRIADRTINIAFYGLSEDMCNLIKSKIPQEENIILNYALISDGDFDAGLVKDKYDLLFTWKGEITDTLSASSEDIPQRLFETMPSSIRDKKKKPVRSGPAE